ncbi:MAG: PD40 domain-containing protein [Bacteroidetes bacterium]|nr:PD40 domain-containing protein [Bacteroidota bacterium]
MNKTRLVNILCFIFSLIMFGQAHAQFYNGHQMTFGKNRIQYYDFYWSYYRFENFDIYFNEFGKEIAEYTASVAEKKLIEIEDYFDYYLNKRLIFIVYNKLSDYKQSNLGQVTGTEDYNTGGYTRVIRNKVMLFFEGKHPEFEKQIAEAITEVLIHEMIYSGDVKDKVASSALINLPDWYIKGLISYIADPWNIQIENRVKDGILSGRYKKFNWLEGTEAVYAGHSFWRYIAKTYGDPIIPNIVYLTRINKNAGKGFLYVLGKKVRHLSKDWLAYYRDYFDDQTHDQIIPEKGIILKWPKCTRRYQEIKINPDNQLVAYVTKEFGQYKIWIYDSHTEKHKKIFSKEPKVEQLADRSYPILSWHPTGKLLAFISEEKGGLVLYLYRLSSGNFERINLLYFDKILDFSYSPDGTKFVFSAVKEGYTDIFIHNIASGTNEQITKDLPDDLNPRFINGGKEIIFSSNRSSDTLNLPENELNSTGFTYDLFIYDYQKKSDYLTRLSEGKFFDKFEPYQVKDNSFLYLNDKNGILNRYIGRFDSLISFIDTTTHYRFFTRSKPLTNYSTNILEYNYSPQTGKIGEIFFHNGKYKMRIEEFDSENVIPEEKVIITSYQKERSKELQEKDSLETLRKEVEKKYRMMMDTLKKPLSEYFQTEKIIDINSYIFEKEKENYFQQQLLKDYPDIRIDTGSFSLPKIRIYETSFFNNYFASQVDFGFLNNSYQTFSGGGGYYNPGINMLFKIGVNDLFENYKIIGGFRFSGNFDSNEYLLSVENLMGDFDKQLIFYRRAMNVLSDDALSKIYTHELFYSMKYPFNMVSALKSTFSLRNDMNVYLSTDIKNLNRENEMRTWASFKLEYIFDNTRRRGINIYYGTRFKLFGEIYKQIDRKKSDLFVIGGDIRHYLKIHRDLIWANRLAVSTSFGSNKLIYYLGGVDNWIPFLSKIEIFDQSVQIDYSQNYAFQTLATNMRGFSQNIRNGNSFALINSELRWPFIRYFANHPISSGFLDNLQIVGFGDIGTAWAGLHPYLGQNAYDREVHINGPITVTINTNREPIVAGFGFGLRSQLFGYFIRADWAWGIENYILLPRVFYISLSLDF